MRALTPHSSTLILTLSLCLSSSVVFAQGPVAGQEAQGRRHDDPQWTVVQQHLANPATASAATLELQGDLLRARRFPEDALDYYHFAQKRSGNTASLMNKIGLIEIELRNIILAHGYFQAAVKLNRNDASGWNNLAATEYLDRRYDAAVKDYKRALKIDKDSAVFHSNLSTAYFERKDFKRARLEADEALRLDPGVFEHSSGAGISAHLLTKEDRGRFAFEMAKVYAQRGQEAEMLHSLAMASETGFDIVGAMTKDSGLAKYKTDPRVVLLVMTAKALHLGGSKPTTSATVVAPPIGDSTVAR